MKRAQMLIRSFVLCLSWQVAVAQQQPTKPMPAAAAGIVAQMDKEIFVSKKKAVEALEKVLRETTKKGDLEGAMAVKQTLDRLNAEIATNRGGSGRGGVDIVGRWKGDGETWSVEFFPDGTVKSSESGVTGTWVLNGASVETKFSNGILHVVERTADGWAGTTSNGGRAKPVRYVRIP